MLNVRRARPTQKDIKRYARAVIHDRNVTFTQDWITRWLNENRSGLAPAAERELIDLFGAHAGAAVLDYKDWIIAKIANSTK